MYSTLHCIALRTIRHSDKNSILSAWTAEAGRVSFAMPEGSGREARRRKAITMPLGLFEGECDIKPGRDILSIRDVKPSPQALGTVPDPGKTVVAMFLADVLDSVLRQPVPDEHLSLFLFDALSTFSRISNPRAVANFHIVFLYRLMRFLGIQPDIGSWRPGAYFDMKEGRFPTATRRFPCRRRSGRNAPFGPTRLPQHGRGTIQPRRTQRHPRYHPPLLLYTPRPPRQPPLPPNPPLAVLMKVYNFFFVSMLYN